MLLGMLRNQNNSNPCKDSQSIILVMRWSECVWEAKRTCQSRFFSSKRMQHATISIDCSQSSSLSLIVFMLEILSQANIDWLMLIMHERASSRMKAEFVLFANRIYRIIESAFTGLGWHKHRAEKAQLTKRNSNLAWESGVMRLICLNFFVSKRFHFEKGKRVKGSHQWVED